MNNVNLIGRLTRASELRQTTNNTSILIRTLVINRTFKNQNGEREADFVNIVVWRQITETIAWYRGKGSQIGVTGRIQTRNYGNQQRQRAYVTEVVAEHVDLPDGKSDGQQGQSNDHNQQPQQNSYMQQGNPFGNSDSMNISDDTLPF